MEFIDLRRPQEMVTRTFRSSQSTESLGDEVGMGVS